jgi:hypothetical protein
MLTGRAGFKERQKRLQASDLGPQTRTTNQNENEDENQNGNQT